jgi:hypothetical protein
MLAVEVPKLGKEAATKAINEWGQPKSKITHLVLEGLACNLGPSRVQVRP